MKHEEIDIFYYRSRLRLTMPNECSYLSVKPVWAAPLSRPNQYLALLDGKDKEITLLADPQVLKPKSWEATQQELRQRYLTAIVSEINSAQQEYGATYWQVQTDRGEREFITQNLQENSFWISDDHLLLTDVDGSRFEIASIAALDARSRRLLEEIL
jgi:hypothetical protein